MFNCHNTIPMITIESFKDSIYDIGGSLSISYFITSRNENWQGKKKYTRNANLFEKTFWNILIWWLPLTTSKRLWRRSRELWKSCKQKRNGFPGIGCFLNPVYYITQITCPLKQIKSFIGLMFISYSHY